MKLSDILQLKGFTNNRIKVVRHTTDRNEIRNIIEAGHFELYQSYQKTNVFKDTEYIIVFRALEGRKALLQGVYKVNKVQKVSKLPDVLISMI